VSRPHTHSLKKCRNSLTKIRKQRILDMLQSSITNLAKYLPSNSNIHLQVYGHERLKRSLGLRSVFKSMTESNSNANTHIDRDVCVCVSMWDLQHSGSSTYITCKCYISMWIIIAFQNKVICSIRIVKSSHLFITIFLLSSRRRILVDYIEFHSTQQHIINISHTKHITFIDHWVIYLPKFSS
jgi:hypothetical protein